EGLFEQAENAARRRGRKEAAAQEQMLAALIEADFGRVDEGRQLARSTLNGAKDPDAEAAEALALARSGDAAGAEAMPNNLAGRFPSDSLLNALELPT